jgi:hypothetical protein
MQYEKSMCKGYKAFGMCIGSLSKHVIEILLIHLKQYFLSLNFFAGCHWISLDISVDAFLPNNEISLIKLKSNFLCREMFMNNYFCCIYCSG